MDDELGKLRELTGQLQKLTYEAVKAGTMAELPEEEQLLARAMQEHMHLKHIHNALEFADLRATGTPAHHAEHVLGGLLGGLMWEMSRASEKGAAEAKARYDRSIQRLSGDSSFREKMTKRFGGSHAAFD